MDKTSKELQLKFLSNKIARLEMQIKALEAKKAQSLEEYKKILNSLEDTFNPKAVFTNTSLKLYLYSDHVDIYDPLHESAPLRFYKDDIRAIEIVLSDNEDFASFRFNPLGSQLLSEAEFESNKDCSSIITKEEGQKIHSLFQENWPDVALTLRTGLNQRYYW